MNRTVSSKVINFWHHENKISDEWAWKRQENPELHQGGGTEEINMASGETDSRSQEENKKVKDWYHMAILVRSQV